MSKAPTYFCNSCDEPHQYGRHTKGNDLDASKPLADTPSYQCPNCGGPHPNHMCLGKAKS